jgi:membrane associated rhomboid family serine protease
VFDSGFDASVSSGGESSSMADRLGISTGPGSPFAYFRGNVSFLFLAMIWGTFALQWFVLFVAGQEVHASVFMLSSDHILWVWTWFTSIFAHSPTSFIHIVGNSIVLYFFGPIVERRVGSRKFAILFVVSGVVAGLAQVGMVPVMDLLGMATGPVVRVLGASGAIMAVMGVLTVLNPNLRVYLYFILPVPLWLLTIGFAGFSVLMVASGSATGGGIAHLAHLAGLVIGLAYGEKLRREGTDAPQQLQFGGGRGPGGPGGPGGRRRF